VLAPTKSAVLAEYDKRKNSDLPLDAFLKKVAKLHFYNTSPMNLATLGETQIFDNLDVYIRSFSPDSREIFEHFDFHGFLEKLDEANLLYLVMLRISYNGISTTGLA
jgi:type I restriction enzyme M protein